jgi:hypothetical protein
MPRIYVPQSAKNEAMKVVANIAGAAAAAAGVGVAVKLTKDHHDKVVKNLKEKGHPHIVKEDHEAAPDKHELLSHTG